MDEGMWRVPKMWQETKYAWEWGIMVGGICFSDKTEDILGHTLSAQMNQRRVIWSRKDSSGWLDNLDFFSFSEFQTN